MGVRAAEPEPGQAVLVRGRLAAVRSTRPYSDGHSEVSRLVEVEYLDGWEFPAEDRIVWERERGARVLTGAGLPDLADLARQPDALPRFAAFCDALRWSSVSRLPGLTSQHEEIVSPWQGAVAIEDYQLVPVLRALEMPRVSLLLADDVGLGKTVEAGLILTELVTRRRVRRALVVCPASLQLQWREELAEKFSLDFAVLDRKAIGETQREYGMDANPWAVTPRAITSMDFLRQPDVRQQFLAAAARLERGHALAWDLLIVDEAHNLAPQSFTVRSDRSQMLAEVAQHFEHRLFLTATPHNGYTVSFSGLLELLDPVRFRQTPELDAKHKRQLGAIMVRRLKSDLNEAASAAGEPRPFADRRITAQSFGWDPAGGAVVAALAIYRDAGRDLLRGLDPRERLVGRFVFSLLTKRLLSSHYAFARSWWRHVDGFEHGAADLDEVETAQRRALATTADDDEKAQREEDVVRQGAAWLRRHAHRLLRPAGAVGRALEHLGWDRDAAFADLAKAGAVSLPPDGKWAAFMTWLDQRLCDGDAWRPDERAIVFTEYRDAHDEILARLRAAGMDAPVVRELSGASSAQERHAVKQHFNDQGDPLRLLIATDVASEGLNLQNSCRYVLHWEIPWNPMRLEQRNGRVDRHGQARDVTCFHFTAADDADLDFLDRVVRKVDQARKDLGSLAQVIDQTVEDRFTGDGADEAELDRRVQRTLEVTPVHRDLAIDEAPYVGGRQAGERLATTQRELLLEPARLARLITEAVALDGGRLEDVGDGSYRLAEIPAQWRRVVDDHVRATPGGPMRRLTFDQEAFTEWVGDRRLYRPRPDLLLLRLGHPLLRSAVAAMRRRLWEEFDPARPLARWTVSAYEHVGTPRLVVHALLRVTNELREVVHAELRPFAYSLDEELAPIGAPSGDGIPLGDEDLAAWREWLAEEWDGLAPRVAKRLEEDRGRLRDKATAVLAAVHQQERVRQRDLYTSRLQELAGSGSRQLDRFRRELRMAEAQAAQLTFDPDENRRRDDEALRKRQQVEAAEFEAAEQRRQQLRDRLTAERQRLLDEVLPRRFRLNQLGGVELLPAAVELAVPEGGRP